MSKRPLVLALALASLLGCSTRKVDVELGGRRLETLAASATREDGRWTVDMTLPHGRWAPSLQEDVPVRTVEVDGRTHARWTVGGDRLAGAPFRLSLQGLDEGGAPSGSPFLYELRPHFAGQPLAKAAFIALDILGGHLPGSGRGL